MGEQKGKRSHGAEFRVRIAERMMAGENVSAIAAEFELPRSMMYRWRDAYRKEGPAALQRGRGRPKAIPGTTPPQVPSAGRGKPSSVEESLRAKIAELERKVGQQAVEIDFFKGVFKRLEELPKAPKAGGTASTPSSGGRRSLKTKR